jgi:DNA polymerase-3 subunit delta'
MQVGKYLEENQPVIYKTFVNSLKRNQLSHAYLLIGNPGTPLLDVAKYLAKTLLCDDPTPFACNSCITCLRVDDDNYPDFILFNGEEGTIKKEAVVSIESQFEKKAFEAKGIRIYILHLVENMTVDAVNSLLKFLEEPDSNVYAFLTTNNEGLVLPTIVSRCQNLYLKSIDRKLVIEEAIGYGVDKLDAQFLSFFYNEPNLIHELVTAKENKDKYEDYVTARDGILSIVDSLSFSKKELTYVMQREITPQIKSKESMRFFLDMLSQVFEDIIGIQVNKEITLKEISAQLNEASKNIKNPSNILTEILKIRSTLALNVNIALTIDHLSFVLTKEE